MQRRGVKTEDAMRYLSERGRECEGFLRGRKMVVGDDNLLLLGSGTGGGETDGDW